MAASVSTRRCAAAVRHERPLDDGLLDSAALASAALVTLVNAAREPLGGQWARDFRAVQADARQHRARHRPPRRRVGELEDAGPKPRLFERRSAFLLERPPNLVVPQAQARAERAYRGLGAAQLGRVAAGRDNVAVEVKREAGERAHRALERGVATRVLTGVEVGEAIDRLIAMRRIVEQVSDAEVQAAAAREHLVAD